MWVNSGAKSAIGWSRAKAPSSHRLMAATEVIGLVMEAMRKIVSRVRGVPAALSRQPTAAHWVTVPPRQTSVAAPASSPRCTTPSSMAAIGSCFPMSVSRVTHKM